MFTVQCGEKSVEVPSVTGEALTEVSILNVPSEGALEGRPWMSMDVQVERITPTRMLEPTKIFERITLESAVDARFKLSSGTYHITASYWDAKGQKISETCSEDKGRVHSVEGSQYQVDMRLCSGTTSADATPTTSTGSNQRPSDGSNRTPNTPGTPSTPSTPPTPPTPPGAPLSFVDQHGWLTARNGKLLDKTGQPVQLKGMSLFWSQWSTAFWNREVVAQLKTQWKSTLIRAAMGVEEGGYLANPDAEKSRVKLIVDEAMKQGIYVIIDWHDHNAVNHPDQARDFFAEMADLYGQTPNVIFEVYNEPVNQSWDQVKGYAQTVIGAIRSKGAKNLVIVGSPSWSQRVDLAADNPIQDSNVAYTLHFYSATHRQDLRDKASYALSKGLTLFVTEFGVCDASGNGNVDLAESDQWMNFMDRYKISWANWSLNDKPESASALKPGVNGKAIWQDGDLTVSGSYVKSKMK